MPSLQYNLHLVFESILSEAGWDLLPHQWQHNMLLLIPSRHTTLTTSVFLLLKGNSYPLYHKNLFVATHIALFDFI